MPGRAPRTSWSCSGSPATSRASSCSPRSTGSSSAASSTVPVIGVALTDLDTDGLRRHVADCVQARGRDVDPAVLEKMLGARPPRRGRLRGPGGLHPPRRHHRRPGRPRRVRGALPRRAAVAVPHGRRRDRRRGPGRALTAGGREAVRPRPGLGPRARRPAAPPLPRGPGVPGRPLPGQGAGRGPAGAAVRQHPARAAVEPAVDRPLRDHDGRGLRRRRPRLVLRRRRDGPRRRAEPPAAGARLPADGPTADDRGRRPARRQAPAAAGGAHGRPGRGGARPVRRLPRRPRASRRGPRPRPTWRSPCTSTTGAGPACPCTSARARPCRSRCSTSSPSCGPRPGRCSPARQGPLQVDQVRLRMQPDAGVTFTLLVKQPGSGDVPVPVPVAVDFRQVLGPVHAAYERIFADALRGRPVPLRPDGQPRTGVAHRRSDPRRDAPRPIRTHADRGGPRPPRRCPARRAGSSSHPRAGDC